MARTKGGANLTQIYEIITSGGGWAFGNLLLNLDQKISTQITGHPKTKNHVIQFDQDTVSEELDSLLNAKLDADSATTDDTKYENGTRASASVSDISKLVGAISYHAVTSTKRRTYYGVYKVTGGDETWQDGEATKIALSLTAAENPVAVTVDAAKFSTAKVNVTSAQTIAISDQAVLKWFNKGSE